MKGLESNVIAEKSRAFAIRVIKLYKYLVEKKRETVLSRQLLRCGTSIGANVREAIQAQSRKDFVAKLCIALKECSETGYWLDLLHETSFLTRRQFDSVDTDCQELMKILTSIIKTTKANPRQT